MSAFNNMQSRFPSSECHSPYLMIGFYFSVKAALLLSTFSLSGYSGLHRVACTATPKCDSSVVRKHLSFSFLETGTLSAILALFLSVKYFSCEHCFFLLSCFLTFFPTLHLSGSKSHLENSMVIFLIFSLFLANINIVNPIC